MDDCSKGFTLIELIAVIVLMSALAAFVAPQFVALNTFSVQASRDDVIAALASAQQIAMARGSTANSVVFTATSNTVSVTENGTALTLGAVSYPLSLSNGVTLSPTDDIAFDKLGRTTARVLTLSNGDVSAQINVSASGYAQ